MLPAPHTLCHPWVSSTAGILMMTSKKQSLPCGGMMNHQMIQAMLMVLNLHQQNHRRRNSDNLLGFDSGKNQHQWVTYHCTVFNTLVHSRNEDGSDEDDIPCEDQPVNISLTLANLESFHGLGTASNGTEPTSYARNGMCSNRIKKALRYPACNCKCSLPFKLLSAICTAFWALSKSAQDSILWSLQTNGSGRRKRYYDIEGGNQN